MPDERSRDDRDPEKKARAPKSQYRKPELTEYGSIAKLTQGTLTRQSDGRTGGFKKKRMCL